MRRSNICPWPVHLRRAGSRFYNLSYFVTRLRPHAHHGARCAMQTSERAHQGARSGPPPSAPGLPACMPARLPACLPFLSKKRCPPASQRRGRRLNNRTQDSMRSVQRPVSLSPGIFPKHADSTISDPCTGASFASLRFHGKWTRHRDVLHFPFALEGFWEASRVRRAPIAHALNGRFWVSGVVMVKSCCASRPRVWG